MAEVINIELLIQAGSTPKTLGEVKQSIKDVTKALNEVPFGTKAFNDLDKVLKQNRETVKNLKKDFDTVQNISIFAKNITGAFGIATSAIALFGGENEKLAATLQKVTAALTLVQSVQQFTEGLKLAKSANDALNASLLTNPYVLVAAAIVACVTALYLFSSGEADAKEKTEQLNIQLDKQKKIYDEYTDSIKATAAIKKSATDDSVEQARIELEVTRQLKKENDRQVLAFLSQEREKGKLSEEETKRKDELLKLSTKLVADEQIAVNVLAKAEKDAAKEVAKEKKEEDKKLTEAKQAELDRQLADYIAFVAFGNEIAKKEADEKKKIADKQKEDSDKKSEDEKKAQAEKLRLLFVVVNETKRGLDKELGLYDLNSKQRIEDLRKAGVSELEITRIIQEGRQKLIDDSNKKILAASKQFTLDVQKDINTAGEIIGQIGGVFNQVASVITQSVRQQTDENLEQYERENEAYLEGLQQRLDSGQITQAEFDNRKQAADKVAAKKKNEILKKEFQTNKALRIVDATINTAAAIVSALATSGNIYAGIVLAAVAGALGAAQIGVIASQKQPQVFAKGGVFAGGGSVQGAGTGTSDSINARLSNGESVINARSTSAFAPLLSAINEAGGGVKFIGQPSAVTNPTGVIPNKVAEPSQATNINVSISEAEITKVQNKVAKINLRSTF